MKMFYEIEKVVFFHGYVKEELSRMSLLVILLPHVDLNMLFYFYFAFLEEQNIFLYGWVTSIFPTLKI
jgi:hypothetical protein